MITKRRKAEALVVLGAVGVLLTSGAIPLASLEFQGPQSSSTIRGRIVDYETRKPLAGVTIAIVETGVDTSSDELGRYVLSDVPLGYYSVSFEREGYYPETRTDVIVRSGRTAVLNLEMLAVRTIQREVSVTADSFPTAPDKPGSQMHFYAEELRRDAGSAGDISRALYNVPGIVKSDEEANDLIVRGGSPWENGFYIDNIFIPNINHFPQQGASGGNISWLNMDFIERLQISTGGFDASFGNRLSAIVDIGYREGNRERTSGRIKMSTIGYGAQIEGPFGDGRGSWMFSGNRSFLDLISGLLDMGNPSDFYDAQGKATYDLDRRNTLSLLAVVGSSKTEYGHSAREKFNTGTAGLSWRHLWSGKAYSDTSVSYSHLDGRENNYQEWSGELHEQYDYHNSWLTIRNVNHVQLSMAHQLVFGVEAQQTRFRNWDDYDNAEVRLRGTSAGAFITSIVHLFHNLSLSSGLRLDYVPLSEHYHLSPRLSFSWMLTERLSLHGAFGIYFQQIPLFLLKQHADNRNLRDPLARHLVLGVRYLLRGDTQLALEAYDKSYRNFPMAPDYPFNFVIDDVNGDSDRFWNFGRLVDEGMAYARGIELTLQKKLARKVYGLVNLTYYRARYRDLMGAWRNRLFDNRFIVCVSGGYKPTRFWEFNVRWTWTGGKAFTPVDEEMSIAYGWPWVNYEDIMSGHLADYRTLSLRADRRFQFRRSNLIAFIGALNLFDHDNELFRFWDPYSNAYHSEYMWGVIPYIGLEFEF